MDPGSALNLFVAMTLFIFAAILFAGGRGRTGSVVLGIFLVLVAINFLGTALFMLGRDPRWHQVKDAALAFDPFYLVLFAASYPYRRRGPAEVVLLVATGVLGAVALAWYLLDPGSIYTASDGSASGTAPAHLLNIAALVIGYAGAWLIAVEAAVAAPTAMLARRGMWSAAAIGIAVVPRFALLPRDLALPFVGGPFGGNVALQASVDGTLGGFFSLLLFLGGYALFRRQALRVPGFRALFRLVGCFTLVLVILRILLDVFPLFGGVVGAFPLRWIIFGALLTFALLSFELVDASRGGGRLVPLTGALIGGLAAFLVAYTYADLTGNGDVAGPLAMAAALGASMPAAVAARGTAQYLQRKGLGPAGFERRLELYRAALESAWARGPPSAEVRARLERDRRTFGVSPEEARALEHVTASSVRAVHSPLAAGEEVLPGIVLERVLGEGAHGRVHLGRRVGSGESIVIKEFHSDAAGASGGRHRLFQELRPLQRLRHPHIVRTIGAEVVRGRYLLLFDYIEGASLEAVLRRRRLPAAEVKALAHNLLDALEAAHQAGVVHRDLKPSNILIDRLGRAYLTDFGIADIQGEVTGATITSLAGQGAITGSVGYMAPEQARGERAVPSTDLYALALVLYEALAGAKALDVAGRPFFEALSMAAAPNIDFEAVPAAWRPFMRRALSAKPSDRFSSAGAMKSALP